MLARILNHHVLANLAFVLVLIIGTASYLLLPREKDPTVNFNWIQISTVMQGAAASDVEKLITDPIEQAVSKVSDIRFISSNSRDSLSSVLIRFEEIDDRTYDKRLTDLRREVQNAENQDLPDTAESPYIYEITSSNAFPTATLVVQGQANDEVMRARARTLQKELERIKGIDRVDPMGLLKPELQVRFHPERLVGLGVTAADLADTVRAYFKDTSAGSVQVGGQDWLLRVIGTSDDPGKLAALPVVTARGEVPLGSLAEVSRGRAEADDLVSFQGKPGVVLLVFKKASTNTLELLDRLHQFIDYQNAANHKLGLNMSLVDDQSVSTRNAIEVMENNALVGLVLVLLVAWVFLGSRIAILTTIGIPFTLAGTFWVLRSMDQSINNSILLGVVISLGMLVDDAVVVVEGIYYRMQRGVDAIQAGVESLKEVFAPVTASVLTTMAAFLPLMLLPGILGDFMKVIPMVVTIALAISLLEAYWMLPTHVASARLDFDNPSRLHRHRTRFTHWLRVRYARWLISVLRWPRTALAAVVLMFFAAVGAVGAGMVHMDFFATQPYRLFYVNVEMPQGTPVETTLERLAEVETRVRSVLQPGDARGVVSYSGRMMTETEPLFGSQYGQVLVSLNPKTPQLREVGEVVAAARSKLSGIPGPVNISFFEKKDGPPTTKPVKIKVRGEDFAEIRAAVAALKGVIAQIKPIYDVTTDDSPGLMELRMTIDGDAVRRAGLNPATVARLVRLMGDGEVATDFQLQGEKVDVRVKAAQDKLQDIDELLRRPVALADGTNVPLGSLVHAETALGKGTIRHYNLRRAITIEAELDKAAMDTVTANAKVQNAWDDMRAQYPGIDLDFSGELDDIQESLDSIAVLFLLGIGVIYLILGTQFESYFQPLMILTTVPMAFTGVVLGLLMSGDPMSLYTLYGVVALAGIAVNSAIVLISAANDRLKQGMSVLHATVYAARRRVVPILITSLTTIAGLFSLATGLGGRSMLWGPVATAIVWGLAFSTVLTLFAIPLLYRFFMSRGKGQG